MSDILPLISLSDLGSRPFDGLTKAQGNDLAEAAAFCLSLSGHHQGVKLNVTGLLSASYQVSWRRLPTNVVQARNDHQEATESGAQGLAILLAQRHLGYEVVLRSRKRTGYDYLMRKAGVRGETITARLEVSGILRGTTSEVKSRCNRKVKQVREHEVPGDVSPAFVMILEFSAPTARIVQL